MNGKNKLNGRQIELITSRGERKKRKKERERAYLEQIVDNDQLPQSQNAILVLSHKCVFLIF